ncbi:protein abrupt isoform X8 [Frankliniella occidentalis]|uniref:Protein abrupt isoform X6 n=1 Tax=Frankliniella occidentalis TaxID=133901 RepID=A0A6J1STN6_FRAOC|nr:protein abrupt isoform X6 [Frankliniella occidentalis]XP_052127055.1 protein abrupt isoform X7 [Frankliniella occidentalis]XP_052127056.1 protein abrupt isoform X8 [Frankliniella occidentalis]
MTAIDAEQFSLRWNNFHNNLTAGFHDLLLGEDLVDVTIAAEGKFVQAHKMVLSVCSPYFKDLFKVNPCKHPIVILKDTGYKELEALLQFMYRGEVNVRQEELAMFLKTAEMLQIKGLTGSDSKKESAEPTSNKTSSNSAPSRTHSLPQDTSTHPPPKRKRSEAPPLPSTSAPTTPSQVVDVTPQTPPEGPSNDQALQDGNDFMNMMNPKMEPQEYDESEDGLDMMADDSVGHDPLVQQLLGGDPKGMAGLGNFVGLPGMKDGNVGQDGGQETAQCPECGRWMTQCNLRRHYRDQHMPNQASRCPHCGKWFRNLSSMQSHKSKYHRTTPATAPTSSAPALTPPHPQLAAGTWTPPPLPPLYSLERAAAPAPPGIMGVGGGAGPRRGHNLQQVPPPVQLETHQLDSEHDIRMVNRT